MNAKLYRFLRPILSLLIKVIFRPKVIGKEYIPLKGKIILAGNHTNILDPVLLLSTTKRTIHFLAKKELIDGPFSFVFKHMGIIPVDRKNKDTKALSTSIEYLKQEKVIGIFPEGTTEKGRGILPFKKGAVKMAIETDCKIVPFAIIGKYSIFKRVTLIYGKPYKIGNNIEKENTILKEKVIELLEKGNVYGKN